MRMNEVPHGAKSTGQGSSGLKIEDGLNKGLRNGPAIDVDPKLYFRKLQFKFPRRWKTWLKFEAWEPKMPWRHGEATVNCGCDSGRRRRIGDLEPFCTCGE